MENKTITEVWLELVARCSELLPEFTESLNSAATEEELTVLDEFMQNVVGAKLPQGLRDIYNQNAGQKESTVAGVFFGMPLLSPGTVLMEMKRWRGMANDDMELAREELATSYPSDAILKNYIVAGHVPFASDGSSNYLGIDLQPGPEGVIGQIINFGVDDNNRFVLSRSLKEFLEWMIAQFQEGNYTILLTDVAGEPNRSIQFSSLELPSDHFLVLISDLFGPYATRRNV